MTEFIFVFLRDNAKKKSVKMPIKKNKQETVHFNSEEEDEIVDGESGNESDLSDTIKSSRKACLGCLEVDLS